jgi:hypothetical protein
MKEKETTKVKTRSLKGAAIRCYITMVIKTMKLIQYKK